MIEGSRVARATLWNLAGQIAPLVFALFTIPALIRGLGADRFGILTLVWLLIGYLSLFDLGVGRALTRSVADRRAAGRAEEVPELTWTGLAITFALGLIAAVIVASLANPLARHVLGVPEELRDETARATRVLAMFLPFVLSATGLRGVLEGHLRFGISNAIRIPLGTFQFVAPWVVMATTRDLATIVLVLGIGRVVAWVASWIAVMAVVPELRIRRRWSPDWAGRLMREGGWMTVSNVVGPLLASLDRFILAASVPTRAIAWYATPFEVVSRLLVVPTALAGVLLPTMASGSEGVTRPDARHYTRAILAVLALVFAPCLVLSALAPELLERWVGAEFARHGTPVMRWLAAGVLVNAVAQIPFTALQAVGRSRAAAILHLVELPIYVFGCAWAVHAAGVTGAAAAWTVRATLDGVILLVLASRTLGGDVRLARSLGALAAGLAMMWAVDSIVPLPARVALAVAGSIVALAVGWRRLAPVWTAR